MDKELDNLLKKALKMTLEQRGIMVTKLIDSLENDADIDVEIAWQKEIQKRIAAAEQGKAEFMSVFKIE